MSIKMNFSRFVRSYQTIDFRTTCEEQMVADRLRRTRKFEIMKHTAGLRSEY